MGECHFKWHKNHRLHHLLSRTDYTYPKCWHCSSFQFFQQHLLLHKCNDQCLEPEHLQSENKITLWNHTFYFTWGFFINTICDLFLIFILKIHKDIKNRENSNINGYMPITQFQHNKIQPFSSMPYLILIWFILGVEGLEQLFKYNSEKNNEKVQFLLK